MKIQGIPHSDFNLHALVINIDLDLDATFRIEVWPKIDDLKYVEGDEEANKKHAHQVPYSGR